MAVPYSDAEADILNGHLRVKDGGSWRTIDDVHVKSGGSWRRAREVYVKHSGSWRSVHEGDHFLFKTTRSSNTQSEFNLNNYLTGQGWNGSDPVKGVLVINNQQQQVRINSLPSDSRVYLRINSNRRIQGRGGNGGGQGGNGGGGQRALYTRATTILNNGGIIAGGGGGGGGGNGGQCVYQNFGQYGCMKGSQCQATYQNFSSTRGGGGGGGAGYPGGSGGYNGGNGQQNSGGGGGGSGGCGAASGGKGGDMGQAGQNSSASGGGNGAGINGASYISQVGSGTGDVRGGQNN